MLCRPDEEAVATMALRFFRGHFKSNFFAYPPLFMYVDSVLYAVVFAGGKIVGFFAAKESFLAWATGNPWALLLIDRIASAAFGVACVAILYGIARRLFDRTTARIAAAFLALAALHVRDSHFGVTDVPATCAVLASFFFTVKFAQDGRSKDLWWSAVLVGLAGATKYNAILIGLPAIAVAAGLSFRLSSGRWPARIRQLIQFGLAASLVFLAAMPFVLTSVRPFLTGFSQEFEHLMAGHGLLLGRGWIVHLTLSLRYGLGWPLLISSFAGFVWMVRVAPRTALLVGLFPVAYFAFMGRGYTVFARYMLPILPFLCLTGAWAVVRLGSLLARGVLASTRSMRLTVLLAALIIAPSFLQVVQTDRLLAITDSRLLAAEWLRSNLASEGTVYQTGRIYSQVQMKPPSLSPPNEDWGFDEEEARFTRGGNVSDDQPNFVIIQRSPLELYTAVPHGLDRILERDYIHVHSVLAYDSSARAGIFDQIDAFFLPLSGFKGIVRPGPNIFIYRRIR